MREKILEYIRKKYGIQPDWPFPTAPEYPVVRHEDNRKWFVIFMDVERDRLGLPGKDRVPIMNVRPEDPFFVDFLAQQPGYCRAYHMNKNHWITVLLDGSVPFEELCLRIDESYAVTASKRKRQKIREPKEWIIPANPKYYDVEGEFDRHEEIEWKQGAGIRTGDTVFMYVAAPISAVLYKCRVTETDIPFAFQNEHLKMTALMRIRLERRYGKTDFTFERLKNEFGIFAVRGPRGVTHSLSAALNGADETAEA